MQELSQNLRLLELALNRTQGIGRLAAVGVPKHHLECFQLVNGGDSIRHRWFREKGWTDWEGFNSDYPRPATDLAVAAAGDDLIELFALAADRRVWHLWWTLNGGWNGAWESFNGEVEGPIAAASLEPGHLEIYAFRGTELLSRWRRADGWWGDDWELPWMG